MAPPPYARTPPAPMPVDHRSVSTWYPVVYVGLVPCIFQDSCSQRPFGSTTCRCMSEPAAAVAFAGMR